MSDIVLRVPIPGGHREVVLDEHGEPVRRVDDYGRGGSIVFGPEWAAPEVVQDAQAKLAAVTEPRRRKARR
jgi:hypothetical protein